MSSGERNARNTHRVILLKDRERGEGRVEVRGDEWRGEGSGNFIVIKTNGLRGWALGGGEGNLEE